MADVPVRFAGLRGTLAAFAVDLFAGRVGSLTDAPMCSGGYDRWGVYDGSAWRLGPASDYAGNANVLSLLVNGTSVIDSSRNVKSASLWSGGAIRVDALGDATLRNQNLSGVQTINGATRPAWNSSALALQMNNGAFILPDANGITIGSGWYYDSNNNKKGSPESVGKIPRILGLSNDGSLRYYCSNTPVVADAAVGTDIETLRWMVNKYGQSLQYGVEIVPSLVWAKISDTIVGPNVGVETSIVNGGILAGGFVAVTEAANRWNAIGAKSRIEAMGTITSDANQVIVFALRRNGTTIATLTLPPRSYGTNTPWRLICKQTTKTTGSSGSLLIMMRAYVTADNANAQSSCYATGLVASAVDLVSAATWDLTVQIPSTATNRIVCQDLEKIG